MKAFTVALIGADGAGKTTAARQLEAANVLPIKYLYMGISPSSSNYALPTTRLWSSIKRALGKDTVSGGPPDPSRVKPRPKSVLLRFFSGIKSGLRLLNLIAEEWYRQCLVWYYLWRGKILLFDRHFYTDYYAHGIRETKQERTLDQRIHGYMLKHFYPKPDLIILLDAPAELLFARKQEGTIELLEMRRQEYWLLQDHVEHFAVIDASQPQDAVNNQILDLMQRFHETGSLNQNLVNHAGPASSTVLVTDAGRGSALAIIRSLGKQGYQVIASDSSPRSLGFRSRYAQGTVLYPDPAAQPAGMVDAILAAAHQWNVDLIIPVTDEIIHPLSRERDRFVGICQIALPDQEALKTVTSKDETTRLAAKLGIPVPGSRTVRTVCEAEAAAADLSWPIVLKPDVSRSYLPDEGITKAWEVSYANDLPELIRKMKQWEGHCAVLMQEYCPGSGQGVEFLAYQGRPLAAFQHKRLAEVPLTGGASAWRESVSLDGRLYAHAVSLVEALSWTGLIMIEFKVEESESGKRYWLMEINGRVWGSLPLALFSGMDFPAKLASLYLDGAPQDQAPDTSYQIGARALDMTKIMSWAAQLLLGKQRYPFLPIPTRRAVLAPFGGILSPRQKFDIWSWNDPGPAAAEIVNLGHKFLEKRQANRVSVGHNG